MYNKNRMQEATKTIEAIYLNYVLNKSKENYIFLFFEGKDDSKYYYHRIMMSSKKGSKLKQYICNCKENVLKIYKKISDTTNEDSGITKLFFVDKDFDDNSKLDKDIYITPTYSIENLYFTDKALKNMLINEMGTSEESESSKKDLNLAFTYLKTKRYDIIREILFVNSCYSLQKNKYTSSIRPNLNNIKKYKDIKNIKTIDDFYSKVSNYVELSSTEIEGEIKRLNSNPVELLRGKYFLNPMSKYINELVGFLNSKTKSIEMGYSKAYPVSLNVSEETILSNFSIYAETPDSLIEYLENKFKETKK